MNENIQVIKVLEKNLSSDELEIINEARVKEFNTTSIIQPKPDDEDWTKIYFIAKNNTKLVAFARLITVNINFLGKTYTILGIGSVIALEKGKGYGKSLMKAVKIYLNETGQTGLGFCNKKTTPFYVKSGYEIIVGGQDRFHYSIPPSFPEGDAIYISGKDDLMKKLQEHPDEIAEIPRPHW